MGMTSGQFGRGGGQLGSFSIGLISFLPRLWLAGSLED